MDLSRIDLVAGLPPEQAGQILMLGRPQRVLTGHGLFHLGELADRVFVIERGQIALTMPVHVREREEALLVEERGPGQTVGWSALIPPHRFTLNATAPLDTDVRAITRTALLDYLSAHPQAAATVMHNVAELMGQRLQVFQAMWLREMQRAIERQTESSRGAA